MSRRTDRSVSWQRAVPESTRRLDGFDRVDYADVVLGPAAALAGMTPQQIARAVLHSRSRRMRLVVLVALLTQRVVLRMRAAPSGGSQLAPGWRIAGGGDDWLRIEAESPLMAGHIVLHREGGRVAFATFVRYRSRAAALIWPPVSLLHRRVGLALMRHALRGTRP